MIRGDIFMLDFGIPFGSEPGFRCPVIIIQSANKLRESKHQQLLFH